MIKLTHPKIDLVSNEPPVVFKELHGISCMVCAPEHMNAAAVIAFVNKAGVRPEYGDWRIVEGAGIAPHPCNQVAGRTHWVIRSEPPLA